MTIQGSSLEIFPNVVSVKGEDARKFLQSIISADVSKLGEKKSIYSLMLNPSGKTLFTMIIYCLNKNEFLLITEEDNEEDLVDSLSKFLIRTKAEIEDVSYDYQGLISYSVSSGLTMRESDHKIADQVFGDHGLKLILRKNLKSTSLPDAIVYNHLRISKGAVSLVKDLGVDSIAQEANLDVEAISFNKGCFLGQELVCRIDSRSASTPSTFYALNSIGHKGSIDDSVVYCGDDPIGVVTSSFSVDENSGDFTHYFGPYNAIAKISRKGVSILEAQGAGKVTVEKKYTVKQIDKVNGHFSI